MMVEKGKYKLTIIFDFEAVDDIEARRFAQNLKSGVDVCDDTPKPSFKFQKIYTNKQPDKMDI